MSGGGGGGGGYTTVQDEGVALTVRTVLNFVGAGVTATDDGTRTVVTIPGGGAAPVTSVFTRTGAVVAVTGDYTAAQVTNAVSTLGSYPNPTWIPSYAYSKLTGAPTIASIQTPWLQNINANSFRLDNALAVGIGKVPTFPLDVVGDCNITGTYYVNGVPLSWATIASDARIKRNVRDLEGGLEVIGQLRPISAEFNGKGGTVEGQRLVSFIAQELAEVLPDAVTSHRGKLSPDDPDETDILQISTHECLMHLVLAVKQLTKRVAELEAATP
jgi:hypothetical protein